jgi:hypothetical protein
MRALLLSLLIISLSFAAEQELPTFNLTLESTCPGDILQINTSLSDGTKPVGIELRLVLRVPFQGLRAIQWTDGNGTASMEISKPGIYRLYIDKSDIYDSPPFVTFNYSEMCPPPPPKDFNLTVEPDCNKSIVGISVIRKGKPLEDVFVTTKDWSSLTGLTGNVSFPLEEGFFYINAEKSGFATVERYEEIDCTPPECLSNIDCDDNQICFNESCTNITGDCGYATNHTWVPYTCCDVSDCGTGYNCTNHSCVELPPANLTLNVTNISLQNLTLNETEIPEPEPEQPCLPAIILLSLAALVVRC